MTFCVQNDRLKCDVSVSRKDDCRRSGGQMKGKKIGNYNHVLSYLLCRHRSNIDGLVLSKTNKLIGF